MSLSVSIGEEDCYHEAGHAAMFTYYDIPLEFVRIRPDLAKGYAGLVKPAVNSPTEGRSDLENWMQCAAAGDIAKYIRLRRKPLEDGELIESFARAATDVTKNPDSQRHYDLRNFAEAGLQRDREILETGGAQTGPESWVATWREAEHLISGRLWPGVQAVGDKLFAMAIANNGKLLEDLPDLDGAEVAALVQQAIRHD